MGGKGQPVRKTDNLTAICELSRENMGASTSHNPMDLHCLLQRYIYLFLLLLQIGNLIEKK
jgi:hypothetical protein